MSKLEVELIFPKNLPEQEVQVDPNGFEKKY